MSTRKFKLDRAGWRKVLVFVFIGLIIPAGISLFNDTAKYRRAADRLESLSSQSVEPSQAQNAALLKTMLLKIQKNCREEMVIHASALLIASVGILFVERKTRK
ncbi:MAG: hypothetical protein WCK57_09185 [Verrucomicrobiae bacterium]